MVKDKKVTFRYFKALISYSNKTGKFAREIYHNQLVHVKELPIRMNIWYDFKAKDFDKTKKDKSYKPVVVKDINKKRACNLYRKKMGLMLPIQIKTIMWHYHFDIATTGYLTGVSSDDIFKLVDNLKIQSIKTDTALRILLKPKTLLRLINLRIPYLKYKLDDIEFLLTMKRLKYAKHIIEE